MSIMGKPSGSDKAVLKDEPCMVRTKKSKK